MSNKPQDAESKQSDSSFIQLDEAKQKGAASAASAPRRKTLLGALTAVCIALIVVSLGFVHPSVSGAWSIDWIVETVTGESVVAKDASVSGSTTASGKAGGKDSKSSDDAKDESKDSDISDSKDDSESSDKKSDKGLKEKKSDGKSAGQSFGSTGGPGSSGGASSGGSTTDGAPVSGGSSASAGNQGGSQESGHVTVTVSVTSSAVGNPVSSGGTFTFNKGATPYDALCALGLSVNAHGSSYGTYVAAIGGLAEKEHGSTSGWMYSVNGATPMTACSNYVLSNGDNVVWYYVTG